jgi:hypothetical protein
MPPILLSSNSPNAPPNNNTLSVIASASSGQAYPSSNASSVISRQSSCTSTSSVIAVPFKTPVRGNAKTASSRFPESPTTDYFAVSRGVGGTNTQVSTPGSTTSYPSSATAGERSSIGTINPIDDPLDGGSTADRRGSSSLNPRVTQGLLSGRPPMTDRVDSSGGMRKTIDDFVFGDVLGEGSYSTVCFVLPLSTLNPYELIIDSVKGDSCYICITTSSMLRAQGSG